MKATEAVRKIMEEQGVGLTKLADRIEKSVRLVSDRLSQENISVKNLKEMLRGLDYKIVIMPRDVTTPKGGVEIE
jgi:signal recognition particle subunit SEC65